MPQKPAVRRQRAPGPPSKIAVVPAAPTGRGLLGSSTMIDVPLLALTRAWIVTVVAAAVLLLAVGTEPIWNSAAYWRGLPKAFELAGDEGPPPVIDRGSGAAATPRLSGLHPVAVTRRF
jgi:hypothetical protein